MRIGKKYGFSLLESLVVLSIISIISAVALASFASARDRNTLEDAQTAIVRALEKARSMATAGVGVSKYGVHIDSGNIEIFAGDSYSTGTVQEQILLSNSISLNPTIFDAVFSRIAGTTTNIAANATVAISYKGNTLNVTVAPDGLISPF